jgi:enoyl-CoA hydratase/carnithine racemase
MDDDKDKSQGLSRRPLLSGATAAATIAVATALAVKGAQAQNSTAEKPAPTYVTLERRESILLIGINRPQVQNRIEVPTFLAIGHAYWQLDHDDALRVAVLFAHGPDFSPGLDPPSWAEGMRSQVFAGPISEFVNPVGTSKPYRQKPVVVAAHGKTQLLGHELFLATDIRVAASDTRFAQAEVARGVYPGGGGTVRFAREAGWGNAMRYMLTGDEWGADEARRMGLVQEVTEPGRELDRALEIAGKIAVNAPMGVRAVLASAHQGLSAEDAALAATFPEFARLMQSEDRQEFARALQEKRAPVYRGR